MVKKGYKQTEIGVIPEDWEVKEFHRVFNFFKTATYSRANLNNSKDVLYLHYGDIHTKYNFLLDFSKAKLPTISKEQAKQFTFLKDGDVVMVDASEDYNGVCKSVEIKNIGNKKAISGLHTFLLREKNNEYVDGFRGYMINSFLLRKQYLKLATGMKVYGLSKHNLKNIFLPIPPKPEQEKIAKVLSDTDELIENLKELITKKEDIKKATMQQLLTGKKRLKGFSSEWVEKKLGEVAKIKKGDLITQQNAIDGDIPVIGGGLTPTYFCNISNRKANTITISASGANAGYVNFYSIPIFASDCSTIEEGNRYNIKFIYYLLKHKQKDIFNLQSGGAQPHVYPEQLEKLNVYIPKDITEQKAIAKILSDIDEEIEALKEKLEKIKSIKQGMMQELLSGRIRLI